MAHSPAAPMNRFQFLYKLRSEPALDHTEREAQTLTEAVKLFLESKWPDGEPERTCDEIEHFSVTRLKEPMCDACKALQKEGDRGRPHGALHVLIENPGNHSTSGAMGGRTVYQCVVCATLIELSRV
jgi:hypothetical protein